MVYSQPLCRCLVWSTLYLLYTNKYGFCYVLNYNIIICNNYYIIIICSTYNIMFTFNLCKYKRFSLLKSIKHIIYTYAN